MAKVTPIRRQSARPTRPAGCERALALMIEAQTILDGLAEKGEIEEGSPPHATLWYLDDAIGMLTPFTPEEDREYEKELRR
ncbi:MAG TPA: hypothetical protein VK580_10775 [Steroidobacteraceae bacterium]|nr:hypothetical protein [Steroidobacteraceae bacterium]